MWQRIYLFLKPGIIPLILAALTLLAIAADSFIEILPSANAVADTARALYERYGLLILVAAALIEGLFMVGIYAPGTLVIMVSVFVAPPTLISYITIAVIVTLSFTITALINYALGYYGFYRLLLVLGGKKQIAKMDQLLKKWGKLAIILTSASPNYLAVTMISYGIARERLWQLLPLIIISLLFWMSLATAIIATIASRVSLNASAPALDWVFVGILTIWGTTLIIRRHRQQQNSGFGKENK